MLYNKKYRTYSTKLKGSWWSLCEYLKQGGQYRSPLIKNYHEDIFNFLQLYKICFRQYITNDFDKLGMDTQFWSKVTSNLTTRMTQRLSFNKIQELGVYAYSPHRSVMFRHSPKHSLFIEATGSYQKGGNTFCDSRLFYPEETELFNLYKNQLKQPTYVSMLKIWNQRNELEKKNNKMDFLVLDKASALGNDNATRRFTLALDPILKQLFTAKMITAPYYPVTITSKPISFCNYIDSLNYQGLLTSSDLSRDVVSINQAFLEYFHKLQYYDDVLANNHAFYNANWVSNILSKNSFLDTSLIENSNLTPDTLNSLKVINDTPYLKDVLTDEFFIQQKNDAVLEYLQSKSNILPIDTVWYGSGGIEPETNLQGFPSNMCKLESSPYLLAQILKTLE